MSRTNRDHAKKTQRPMLTLATRWAALRSTARRVGRCSSRRVVIENQLEALLTPSIVAQEHYYHSLKLRDRILNLPLMIAAVLTLLWRDVAGVTVAEGFS